MTKSPEFDFVNLMPQAGVWILCKLDTMQSMIYFELCRVKRWYMEIRKYRTMRWIFAIAFGIIFAQILLPPSMGYSFQIGNNSIHNYTIGIVAPSHDPAVVVTRVPYSLQYGALFQPRAGQIGQTMQSSIIGQGTSANILAPPKPQTQTSLPKYAVNLTNNMTALNLSNKMAQQTLNMSSPSNVTSTFNVTIPVNMSMLK